jgi:hypothetical protein
MTWDYHTYMDQPVEFIEACEHWAKKDFEKQQKS